jgi:Rrf2 family protein
MSQRCQYALRAVFDLVKRHGSGPTTIGKIAESQAIPPRFLELILGQLRQGGFVESRRGVHGGYLLAVAPESLTVGEIIRFVEGPVAPVRCVSASKETDCPLYGQCAFMGMWSRACDAATEVYDTTTFQNLIDKEQASADRYVGSYSI